jgi:ubiquinone/menaquinone biosynthesis C-methylase UbiE
VAVRIPEPGAPDYVLRHSEREHRRLVRQHELFGAFTRQLLVEAGVGPGLRVLDLGSGTGAVSLLLAELVGPEGSVVGVESNASSVAFARDRAAAEGVDNVRFVVDDVGRLAVDEQFDAAVGRFILAWLADPVGTIRLAAAHTRPGGVVVFQDFDHPGGPRTWPRALLFDATFERCLEVLRRSGFDLRMGAKLFQSFVAAGLPRPALRMDVRLGGPDFPGCGWLADSVRSLLPRMIELGLTTADETDVDTLEERMRTELATVDGTAMLAPVVGAWARLVP